MTATLHLKREASYAIELRRGPFEVLLDGLDVGTIERDHSIDVPMESGHHTLQVKAGRFSSATRSFDAVDGDVINFRCNGAVVWPVYVASLVKTDLALNLKRL